MTAKECIFCEIAAGRAPASVEYEDERAIAFSDINPAAPVHILIVPKKHIASIADLSAEDEPIVGHLVSVAKKLAENRQLEGYKLIFNVGEKGGQVVFHLHLHLLGGWDKKPQNLPG
ncbi:MAG: histidine triad nucleotide-binding protein [Candidatus Peribacteraceae bacterium]|nr:histidine triad nucleotide-binding protein [Candidatus Peribacteraceae bacterium]